MKTTYSCPCCGSKDFVSIDVLWPDLIKEWKLRKDEVAYINRQQGLACENCARNLRSMTLAGAILNAYNQVGTFEEFVTSKPKLDVLELNEAGNLNDLLVKLPQHLLASYPKVDMQALPYKADSYDLIVHSDTLEHVENPLIALRETWRVLRPGGFTCFTTPIIVDRLTSNRSKKNPSYHGSPGNHEYLVQNEFGSDIWKLLFEAGFLECRLYSLEYPASIAVIARKNSLKNESPPRKKPFINLRKS